MTKPVSKIQAILDRIDKARDIGDAKATMDAVVDALKLLAQGEAQLLGDVAGLRHANIHRTDIPIGSNDW